MTGARVEPCREKKPWACVRTEKIRSSCKIRSIWLASLGNIHLYSSVTEDNLPCNENFKIKGLISILTTMI